MLSLQSEKMAGDWFSGLGQTIAGGIATAVTFGQVDEVNKWTVDGAKRLATTTEKTWGKDGEVTKFVESTPVLGYVASAGHAIAGDEQRAKRAAATSTKSTLVTTGVVVGSLGGPPGAAVGGALGSVAGQCAEKGINHAIDEEYQTDAGTYDDFDGVEFVKGVAIDGAFGGIGSGASSTVGKVASRAVVGESMKVGGKVVTRNVGRYVVKRSVESAVGKGATFAAKK